MALIEKFTVETQMHMGNKRHNIDKNHIWSKQTNTKEQWIDFLQLSLELGATEIGPFSVRYPQSKSQNLQLHYSYIADERRFCGSFRVINQWRFKTFVSQQYKSLFRLKSENIKDMNSGFNKDKFYNLNKCFFKVEEIIPHNTWSVSTSYTINIGIFLC